MEVRYNEGMMYPVEIASKSSAICIKLDDAKKLRDDLACVIKQAEEESTLNDFEKAVLVLCEDMFQGPVGKKEAKKRAAKLLALAREELKKKFVLNPISDHLAAFDMGKAEALKALPKWRYATKNLSGGVLRMDEDGSIFVDMQVFRGEYYIPLSELRKLPKEE